MVCDPVEEANVCVVCSEDEGLRGPPLFDCGHAVCFACTTGMLLATYRDANFAMHCPFHSLNGCEGRVAVLPEHKVDARALLQSHPDAPEEWKRYMQRLDDAILRAAGMFACPSAFCSRSERVLFVPTAAAHASCVPLRAAQWSISEPEPHLFGDDAGPSSKLQGPSFQAPRRLQWQRASVLGVAAAAAGARISRT